MNKPKNTMKVSFPSRGANEGLARMLIAAFVTEADPTVEELCDIKTAVSEAVTNCIVHAYPDRVGPIVMTLAASPRFCSINSLRRVLSVTIVSPRFLFM